MTIASAIARSTPIVCHEPEWETRRELSAVYHLLKKYRLTDLTNQWHAARVPGEKALLTHHYGLFNEEITASNLIKVGFDGTNMNPENGEPNPSATEIAKVFFEARPEINCVMHIHTKAIMGVSAQSTGLQPYSQAFLMIGGAEQIGYTRYEFECTDDFLSGLLKAAHNKSMIVEAFHGAFVLGRTVGEAFFRSFYLDQACAVQLEVQSAGAAGATLMTLGQPEIDRHLADMAKSDWYGYDGELEWKACLRCVDRESPDYKR
jgi:ribulose-5-phosphate 4-epimerase/fuculose-1-phosphate aldolase